MKNKITKISIATLSAIAILFTTLFNVNIKKVEHTDYSSIFVASYYAARYPDLKAAGITSDAALLNHFVTSGMKEGRQGSEEFNVYVYMNNYPDLKAAFGNDLPKYYLHYMNAGKAEGRVARGNATAPATTTVPTTPTVNSGALHTAPAYSVLTDYDDLSSKLSYKVGDTYVYWNGTRSRKVTKNDLYQWNYNPYGFTSGTSALTGSASIGDIRYINYSLAERYTGRQAHSVKMECYAINKNGVPLFRRVGSSYNVYTQDKSKVAIIDSITPTMSTAMDIDKVIHDVGWGYRVESCTESANIRGAIYGQFLIESYHLVSDTYNHEECLPYMGNGLFLRTSCGYGYTTTVADMFLTKGTQPGTFKVYYSSQK